MIWSDLTVHYAVVLTGADGCIWRRTGPRLHLPAEGAGPDLSHDTETHSETVRARITTRKTWYRSALDMISQSHTEANINDLSLPLFSKHTVELRRPVLSPRHRRDTPRKLSLPRGQSRLGGVRRPVRVHFFTVIRGEGRSHKVTNR